MWWFNIKKYTINGENNDFFFSDNTYRYVKDNT